jgi:predicted TIM-barrel fold metal-dependent hydrolase
MRSKTFIHLGALVLGVVLAFALKAQNTTAAVPPVIDVHFHAMEPPPDSMPFCPNQSQFLASDPADGEESQWGWSTENCTPKLYPAKKGEYLKDLTEDMKRLNVTAVVFGDADSVAEYEALAPGRIIPGTSFDVFAGAPPKEEQLKRLEYAFTKGGFRVMGEIAPQYAGMSPSDMNLDDYFSLAERLDIPVAIHMGTGGSGRANVYLPQFRASLGDPFLLEDLLGRHPGLRLWIMHAGYPLIDHTLALLQTNSHVYVDVAGLIWSYPMYEVNRYIERLVRAGFGDRVMFGTDQLIWPGLMAYSISIIQNADYLTSLQKRDILCNNAARFLRLGRDEDRNGKKEDGFSC